MPTDLFSGSRTSLANFIALAGGLRTAAYGLEPIPELPCANRRTCDWLCVPKFRSGTQGGAERQCSPRN
jgi:hypothetical protein